MNLKFPYVAIWILAIVCVLSAILPRSADAQVQQCGACADSASTHDRTTKVDGVDIFYREAGSANSPAVLLLHGFPTSSHMFRNLIPALSDRYHVIAPDYPGFGHSGTPNRTEFTYSFACFAELMDGWLKWLYSSGHPDTRASAQLERCGR
jgi:predicted alpha/beta-fold hydrolase